MRYNLEPVPKIVTIPKIAILCLYTRKLLLPINLTQKYSIPVDK